MQSASKKPTLGVELVLDRDQKPGRLNGKERAPSKKLKFRFADCLGSVVRLLMP